MTATEVPVAIVGMGPVGLTLAADLVSQGIRCLLVDKKESIQWTSRATCISRRSQEILQRIGVGPELLAKGLGWHRGRTFHRRTEVFELVMPFDPHRDAHAPMVNLQQCYTEQFLLDTVARHPELAECRWSSEFISCSQHADGLDLLLRDPTGRSTAIRAQYLVGCDGARSVVRAAAGMRLKGRRYEGRYLISDIRMVEPVDRPVERCVWFDPESNPGSTAILHVQPDRVWRIDIQADTTTPDEVLLDETCVRRVVQSHLDMMGISGEWQLIWHSIYRANALSLDTYRCGRVFLAGDAAHLVPIFGVRGMNSGIDDAHNLAWKLAAALRGTAGGELLDSYTAERRQATLENLGNAVRSTWFMSPQSEGYRIMRDATLLLARRHTWARALINPRQSSAHVYRESACVAADAGESGFEIVAGAVLPNLPVQHPMGHLHDHLGSPGAFTLLVDSARLAADDLRTVRTHASSAAVCLVEVGETGGLCLTGADHGSLFGNGRGSLMVVRPDEHIAGWADNLAQLQHVLDRARGHVPAASAGAMIAVEDAGLLVPPSPLEQLFEDLAQAIDRGEFANATVAAMALLFEQRYGAMPTPQ